MPDQLKVARVTGATLGSDLPARFSELETAISVITGIPLDVLINNPMTEVVAAGLRKVLLQNLGADPTVPGQLSRNGAALRYFDAASRTVLHTGNRQFRAKMIMRFTVFLMSCNRTMNLFCRLRQALSMSLVYPCITCQPQATL